LVGLYSFVHKPDSVSPYFLHFVNLAKAVSDNGKILIPNLVLAVLAGVTQFWQSKLMMPASGGQQDTTAKAMNMQMTYVLPVVSIVVAWNCRPAAPVLGCTTLFAVGSSIILSASRSQAFSI